MADLTAELPDLDTARVRRWCEDRVPLPESCLLVARFADIVREAVGTAAAE